MMIMRKWIGIWDWWANKAFATVIQFLDPHLHFLFLSLLLLYFALLGFNFTVSLSLPLPSFYDPLMFSFSQNYCLPLLSSPLCHVLLSCLSFSLPLLGVVFVVTVFSLSIFYSQWAVFVWFSLHFSLTKCLIIQTDSDLVFQRFRFLRKTRGK